MRSAERFVAEPPGEDPATSGHDPLSDVLAALHIDYTALYIFDLHDPWEIALSDVPVAISWTVMEGVVWIHQDGKRIELHRGDTFLLPRGGGKGSLLVSCSNEKSQHAPIAALDLFQRIQLHGVHPGERIEHPRQARWGGDGPLTRVVSAVFGLSDPQVGPLIAALPDLTLVRAQDTGNELVDIVSRLAFDDDSALQPGFAGVVTQVVQLLLVHIVRSYALSTGSALGWLAGMGDPQIARALASLHREPALPWSVTSLARIAGLSRSQFATRFNASVGQTAMQYLRAWRMHLAREALVGSTASVSTVAFDLGYQSEAAFRSAFRRSTGQSPREFRRRHPADPAAA